MSEVLQFEPHPDADQIGAFVEHALPAHELEHLLNHLAVCQECRVIVALSLPTIEEPAKPLSVTRSRPWWSGWALAWPALAVTAALAVLVVYVHHAKSDPGSVPPQEAKLQQTVPLETPKVALAPTPESPAPRPTRDVRPSTITLNGSAVSLSRKDEQGTIVSNVSASQADSNVVATLATPDRSASVNVKRENAPSPQTDSNVVSTLITSQEITELPTKSRNISSLAALAPGVSDNKAVMSANPAKSAAASNAKEAAAGSSVASVNNELELQSKHLKHRLPSRLLVLSMVVNDRRIIAIDMRYAVFLSADAGKHWKPVRAPWTGRPVLVELASAEPIVREPAMRTITAEEHNARPTFRPVPSPVPAENRDSKPASNSDQGSSLTGMVTDQTGAVVSGATVRVSNLETSESRSVQSNGTGLYLFNGLVPGTYNLRVVARGFETYLQSSIAIPTSAPIRVDVRLMIGAETETISVMADALAVQTDSNVVSTLIKPDEPAPVFEITTDNLDHWTSTDGITWKRK
jgi:hypothetical protein